MPFPNVFAQVKGLLEFILGKCEVISLGAGKVDMLQLGKVGDQAGQRVGRQHLVFFVKMLSKTEV